MITTHTQTKRLQLLVFSLVIGGLSGGLTALFGRGLLAISHLRTLYFPYLIPFLALAGVAILFSYQQWGKEVQSGMGLVFQAGQGKKQLIAPVLIPLIIGTTWLGHLFGASVGREGVAVQLGATLSHWLKKHSKQALPIAAVTKIGMAAGFAGLFQTPLAASFFASEVLFIKRFDWHILPYCLLSSFTAATTSHLLGLEKFSFLIQPPSFQLIDMLSIILIGIGFALIGNGFAWLLHHAKQMAAHWFSHPYLRMLILGGFISILLFSLHQGRYTGLGTNLIEASLSGHTIHSYDWLLKLLLTCACLAIGFQGGEVTPLFAIGASSGVIMAQLLGMPTAFVAALGYAAVFGSATNTLFAPIFISYEVFGIATLPYAIPVMLIAYFFNHKQTIYSLQIS